MKDAFDVLMITHSSLCKGYEGALKLILDIDDDDFGTLSFENAESLEDFSEKIKTMIDGVYKDRNLVVLLIFLGDHLQMYLYHLSIHPENLLRVSIFHLF